MSPSPGVVPRIFINGVEDVELRQGLESLSVHFGEGQAAAVIECVGALPTASGIKVGVDADDLVIPQSNDDGVFFSGRLTEVELRVLPHDAPRVVLRAAGPVASRTNRPPVALRFGADVASGSVRRVASGLTAQLVTNRWDLGVGAHVDLTTGHDAFDGRFRIVENRCYLDPRSGLLNDVVATSATA
jgi:hypothetical protein